MDRLEDIIDELYNSDHKSKRQKQDIIKRFAEEVCYKDSEGWTAAHYYAKGKDFQALQDLFFLVEKFAPHIIPAMLTMATNKNQTVGHKIAQLKDPQRLAYFLDFVIRTCLELFSKILLATNNSGWNMGHYIAVSRNAATLKTFFDYVLLHSPDKLPEIIDATLKDGAQIAHLIAKYQDPQTLNAFLDMLKQYDENHKTDLYKKVLTSPLRKDWHIGYFIAQYQNHDSVVNFLNHVEKNAPECLPDILKATTSEGWHLGHLIAEYQSAETLVYYLDMVIKHAPNSLADILNAREEGPRLLGVLVLDNKPFIGRIVYQLIASKLPLGEGMYERLQCFKKSVLEQISRLPANEQVALLPQCLDRSTPFGLYFNLKQDIIHRHMGENRDLLEEIDRLLEIAKVECGIKQSSKTLCAAPHLTHFSTDAHREPLGDKPCRNLISY